MQTRVIAVVEHPADDGTAVEGDDGPAGRSGSRREPPDDQESLYL